MKAVRSNFFVITERGNIMEYRYFIPRSQQEVSLPQSSFFQKLFCKHENVPLIREKKNQLIHNIRGDTIQYVCCKCGKLGGLDFWEFEGMGYR